MSFHDQAYCVAPDLDHSWTGSHAEANFSDPPDTLGGALNDGFVRVNDATEQTDGPESPTDDDTMGYYDDSDLPFYYGLAETLAIDDRDFSPALGPTAGNRFFLMAATSFGHLDSSETLAALNPPPGPGQPPMPVPYAPVTGSIFGLLDRFKVSWTDYYSDVPEAVSFVPTGELASKAVAINQFYADAAAGRLPKVAFVESAQGDNPFDPQPETDEHPPSDIRAGQQFVSQVVNAIRSGPNWKDSIVFITYDEAGGAYDHVAPLPASQGGGLSPDGINPGQCEDLSNPPESQQPGGGMNCSASRQDAQALCPALAQNPVGHIRRIAPTSISTVSGCRSSRCRHSPSRTTSPIRWPTIPPYWR